MAASSRLLLTSERVNYLRHNTEATYRLGMLEQPTASVRKLHA